MKSDQSTAPSTFLSTFEVVLYTGICFGWAIFASVQAVLAGFPAQGFNDGESSSLVFSELIAAAIVLVILWVRRYPIAMLLPKLTARGTALGALLFLAGSMLSLMGMSLFSARSLAPIDDIMSASQLSSSVVLVLSVVNGLYEEVFLLALIQRGLMRHGAAFAVGMTALIRMSYHLYQGPAGAFGVLLFGLCLAYYYLKTQDLWAPCFAHILADTFALL